MPLRSRAFGMVALLATLLPAGGPPDVPLPGVKLVTGQRLTPAGTHEFLGDQVAALALSPDGRTLAAVSGGASLHKLQLLDPATGKLRQEIPLVRAQLAGLAWSADGATLFIGGGNGGKVNVVPVSGGRAGELAAVSLPGTAKSYQAGLALDTKRQTLYVTDWESDRVLAISLPDGAEKRSLSLDPRTRPGRLLLAPDGKRLYAALWGAAKVLELDPETLATRREIAVGAHPNALLLAKDRLFVSCGNEDAVFVVDAGDGHLRERVKLSLTPEAPAGSTPSALALTPDGRTLAVACSDLNAVALLDVAEEERTRVAGYLPTAWYPTAVAFAADGKRLFVGSGKGIGTGPNPKPKPPGVTINEVYSYITTLLRGVLSTVDLPDARALDAYTKQVLANTPYARDSLRERPAKAPRRGSNPIPSRVGDRSPIRHVLYIIKENRTYDQVFGDLGKGNGDPGLCLFGEEITPNQHALAREFVLFDNLYASGEVSVDGHHWSNGAYVPDSMQRTWPAQYGAKGSPPIRSGDFGDPLAATPAGRIWDLCAQKGVSFRTYYYHTDKNRSDVWAAARGRQERDYIAADLFVKDLADWEKDGGAMPRFMVMALSEDHTRGVTPGAFTPQACVASNDLALGKIVEACSKSRFWKEMAIFVIEDDAQNGPDHVDAHRTVALAISPYTRRGGQVDSTFYNTCSLLRTMELILGLPPMSQFDAGATPLYAAFSNRPDPAPFVCRPARIDLQAKNPPRTALAALSAHLDFSAPDRLTEDDEETLNRVLWHAVKGMGTPYPGVVRRFAPGTARATVRPRSARDSR